MNKLFSVLVSIFFTTLAWAQTPAAGGPPATGATPPGWMQFVPIAAIFLVMYFLMIRPQAKKQKEQQALLNALKVGDQVITQSGLFGKISEMNEQTINLTIAQGVQVKILRSQIMGLQQALLKTN
jgi:preprotein translocase subunit YajC